MAAHHREQSCINIYQHNRYSIDRLSHLHVEGLYSVHVSLFPLICGPSSGAVTSSDCTASNCMRADQLQIGDNLLMEMVVD
jgi:hypothetical protein